MPFVTAAAGAAAAAAGAAAGEGMLGVDEGRARLLLCPCEDTRVALRDSLLGRVDAAARGGLSSRKVRSITSLSVGALFFGAAVGRGSCLVSPLPAEKLYTSLAARPPEPEPPPWDCVSAFGKLDGATYRARNSSGLLTLNVHGLSSMTPSSSSGFVL
jgi:hypothetical protein